MKASCPTLRVAARYPDGTFVLTDGVSADTPKSFFAKAMAKDNCQTLNKWKNTVVSMATLIITKGQLDQFGPEDYPKPDEIICPSS